MSTGLRSQLSQMLSDLRTGIQKMTSSVMENFDHYERIVNNYDDMTSDIREETISEIKTNDLSVHALGDALEEESVKILSLQAPVGRDLRTVISSFRIIYDIQRISKDTSHSFVGLTSFIGKQSDSFEDQQKLFRDSIQAAKEMMDIFTEVYQLKVGERNFEYEEYIKRTEDLDDVIDDLFENHSREIIKDANEGSIDPKSAHRLLSAIRSLERVGDHCCNIVERAIYIKSGDKVHVK